MAAWSLAMTSAGALAAWSAVSWALAFVTLAWAAATESLFLATVSL